MIPDPPIATPSVAAPPLIAATALPAGPMAASRRTIFRNFAGVVGIGLISRAVGILLDVYGRRVLKPQAIGIIDWNNAALAYTTVFSNPGLQSVARRETAKNPNRIAELFVRTTVCQLIPLLLIALACVVCKSAGLRPGLAGKLLILQAAADVLLAFQLRWAFEAVDRYVIVNALGLLSLVVTTAGTMIFVHSPDDAVQLVFMQLAGSVVLAVATLYMAARGGLMSLAQVAASLATLWQGLGQLWRDALPLSLATFSATLYVNGASLVLGPTHGDAAVGLFSTAYSLMALGTVAAGTLNNVYFASLARAGGAQDGGASAAQVSFDYFRAVFLTATPFGLLGWSIGRYVLQFVYGPAYASVGAYFEWLCLYLVCASFTIGLAGPLVPWGNNSIYLRVTILGAASNFVLTLLLVPRYGVSGAVATVVLTEAIIAAAVVRIRCRIVPIPARHTLLSLLPMFGVAVVGKWLAGRWPSGWPLIGALAAVSIGVVVLAFNPPIRSRLMLLIKSRQ